MYILLNASGRLEFALSRIAELATTVIFLIIPAVHLIVPSGRV